MADRPIRSAMLVFILSFFVTTGYSQTRLPRFRAETIDSKVGIGYGVAIGDVDGDTKPDILLADKKQIAWYHNPTWKRYVIAENLTERDNVCLAARDIDGDGKVEIAVGAQWNPGDTEKSGAVFYLVPTNDRQKMWTPIRFHHEPVVHRMRWVRTAKDKYMLVVAPLHGRGNKGGEGQGVRLLAYEIPKDPSTGCNTYVLDDEMHVTHNFDVAKLESSDTAESIFYYGKEGAKLIQATPNGWKKQVLRSVQGGGEIRLGQSNGLRFLATIEPFHGTELVYYPNADKTGMKFDNRIVLDDQLNQGHAIAVADLFGNGQQQIVAGWRKKNREGKFGVKLFYQQPDNQWESVLIDDDMACEDLRIADLNGDGSLDIVASGRSTHNLKVYWNEKAR